MHQLAPIYVFGSFSFFLSVADDSPCLFLSSGSCASRTPTPLLAAPRCREGKTTTPAESAGRKKERGPDRARDCNTSVERRRKRRSKGTSGSVARVPLKERMSTIKKELVSVYKLHDELDAKTALLFHILATQPWRSISCSGLLVERITLLYMHGVNATANALPS